MNDETVIARVRAARIDEQFENVERRRHILYPTRRSTAGATYRPRRVRLQVKTRRQSTKGSMQLSDYIA